MWHKITINTEWMKISHFPNTCWKWNWHLPIRQNCEQICCSIFKVGNFRRRKVIKELLNYHFTILRISTSKQLRVTTIVYNMHVTEECAVWENCRILKNMKDRIAYHPRGMNPQNQIELIQWNQNTMQIPAWMEDLDAVFKPSFKHIWIYQVTGGNSECICH